MSGMAVSENTNSIGFRLQKARKRRGWTQEILADESGVSQTGISEIESGAITNPGIKTLSRLARALDIQLMTLIGDGA